MAESIEPLTGRLGGVNGFLWIGRIIADGVIEDARNRRFFATLQFKEHGKERGGPHRVGKTFGFCR